MGQFENYQSFSVHFHPPINTTVIDKLQTLNPATSITYISSIRSFKLYEFELQQQDIRLSTRGIEEAQREIEGDALGIRVLLTVHLDDGVRDFDLVERHDRGRERERRSLYLRGRRIRSKVERRRRRVENGGERTRNLYDGQWHHLYHPFPDG